MTQNQNGQNDLPPVNNDSKIIENSENRTACETELTDNASSEGELSNNVASEAEVSDITPDKTESDNGQYCGFDLNNASGQAEIAKDGALLADTQSSAEGCTKKVFSVLGTVLTVLILALTAFIVVNIVIARVQNKNVSLLGYSFGIVQTASMEPEIMVGDMIVYKSCDISSVEVGNYIVFVAGDSFGQIAGQNVIHSVVDIESVDGSLQITTKGINNFSEDRDKVTAENFLGICTYYSSFWGGVLTFLSKFGIIIIIALVAIPFIVKQIIKIVKLARDGDDESENNQ
ncbi:MAG: signal peptidase I [Candidatus Coproplasma sp.]